MVEPTGSKMPSSTARSSFACSAKGKELISSRSRVRGQLALPVAVGASERFFHMPEHLAFDQARGPLRTPAAATRVLPHALYPIAKQ
jgi:hypothetical protein